MDEKQIKTLKAMGFAVEELPGRPIPKMEFWNRRGEYLGYLLADPHNLERHLGKGFTIKPPDSPQENFTCETCGKSFALKVALAGHSRSHKQI